jgi:hypothetical protein
MLANPAVDHDRLVRLRASANSNVVVGKVDLKKTHARKKKQQAIENRHVHEQFIKILDEHKPLAVPAMSSKSHNDAPALSIQQEDGTTEDEDTASSDDICLFDNDRMITHQALDAVIISAQDPSVDTPEIQY